LSRFKRFIPVKRPAGEVVPFFQLPVYAAALANYASQTTLLCCRWTRTLLRRRTRRVPPPGHAGKIQRFLDDLAYNQESGGETCRSPRRVLRDRTAALHGRRALRAAALAMLGHPPLLLDSSGARRRPRARHFSPTRPLGALAKSNYSGLRYREPVYRTLRELAMSYFEHYYNLKREKTLRNYSRPVNLRRSIPSIG